MQQHHARDETENINITENNAYGIHKECMIIKCNIDCLTCTH